MAAAVQKITLSTSRDIPFNKLVLSQANVRRIKAGVSIEELAEDIARRTLLQSLTVRAVYDADGNETGMFEIPAGGRRYRALELLVRQKRLAKTAPIPCVIREGGIAEEDSLAENIQRAPPHPLDQFRAFMTLREKGQSEEEIAAVFFVSVGVVKQRLRLASVSPKLLDIYAVDGMTLDQLMAYTVSGDHARQDEVFERLSPYASKDPHVIRRLLTEGAVRAADKRARYVGAGAYIAAGGLVLRHLFQGDDGGWPQDAGLLNRMVAEKLQIDAENVRGESWKWIEAAPDFSYGHTYSMRQLRGEQVPLSEEEETTRDALRAEMGNWRRPTARPMNYPRGPTGGWAKSRRRSRLWIIDRWCSIRRRSTAPGLLSASTHRGICALNAGSGWLHEPPRAPGRVNARPLSTLVTETTTQSREGEDTAEDGGETAMAESAVPLDDGFAAATAHETAAE